MNLSEAMSMLNDRQREAVEHLEGPLLVVAGPGTGKTQLLSLRAANILATRDVQPQNILCLTYTDAGVEAMRHRLVGLVGRDAYGIEVSTFHSFALGVRAGHPEYFHAGIDARPVSDLYAREIVDSYLKRLPYGSPLSSVYQGGSRRTSTRSRPSSGGSRGRASHPTTVARSCGRTSRAPTTWTVATS